MSGFRQVGSATALCCAFATAATAQTPRSKFREVLEHFRSESKFPGAMLGVWRPGSSPIVVVVGVADRERRLPMSQQALLHAGSAGKMLFAALALQLVAEGRMGRLPERDVERWRAHLEATRVPIEAEMRWPQGGYSLYLRDPAGNGIEFATAAVWGIAEPPAPGDGL